MPICPHCHLGYHQPEEHYARLLTESDLLLLADAHTCPTCARPVVHLTKQDMSSGSGGPAERLMVYPAGVANKPLPDEVPRDVAEDYLEARAVLPTSRKASAALSRRCLQVVIREHLHIRRRDLFQEIQAVIDEKLLPFYLASQLDAVREVGNFAAHPLKSESTGLIVPVEPEEAEWLLQTLEGVLHAVFVEPARAKARREALDAKLRDAGKKQAK